MKKIFLIILLTLFSSYLFGAITHNSTSSTNGSASSFVFSLTVNSGNNRMLVVGVGVNDNSASVISGVTFDGVALTQKVQWNIGSQITTGVFYLINPPIKTANVVVTLTGSNSTSMGAVVYNGVDSLGASAQNAFDSNKSPTVSITTTQANSWIVNVFSDVGGPAFTKDGTCTQRYNERRDFSMQNIGLDKTTTTASLYTITHSLVYNEVWQMYALELKEFVPPTPTITPTITKTITRTITPTITRTITKTATPTITQTITQTVTPTITLTITETITPTTTPTVIPDVDGTDSGPLNPLFFRLLFN